MVANEVKGTSQGDSQCDGRNQPQNRSHPGRYKSAVGAIAEVSSIIGQINDISNSIASAVNSKRATTNEIGRHVHEAARGSAEITKSIATVAESAKETARGALETQDAAQALTELAARMQDPSAAFDFCSQGRRQIPASRLVLRPRKVYNPRRERPSNQKPRPQTLEFEEARQIVINGPHAFQPFHN